MELSGCWGSGPGGLGYMLPTLSLSRLWYGQELGGQLLDSIIKWDLGVSSLLLLTPQISADRVSPASQPSAV